EMLRKLFGRAKRSWKIQFGHEPNWSDHTLREPEARVRELNGDEGERLEAEVRRDYLPFFGFARESGLRKRECIFLRWSEVNWQGGQIAKSGKGGKRITCPLTPTIRAILEPLQGHHAEFVFTRIAN